MKLLPLTAVFLILYLTRVSATLEPRLSYKKRQEKPACRNTHTIFSKDTGAWNADSSPEGTFDITPDGLKMNILPPEHYERLIHAETKLPYNKEAGRGPTFNSSTYMHYGNFSAKVKSSPVGGAITAVILIADGGDEIDFELIGGVPHTAQTNYFWGKHPLYTVNGGTHDIEGAPVYEEFHEYVINWTPDVIVWKIDGKEIRRKERQQTCEENGVCKFPSHPARVQIGFWDGSYEFGTAEWAHGPINWDEHDMISSYLQEVVVECDPDYNQIVD